MSRIAADLPRAGTLRRAIGSPTAPVTCPGCFAVHEAAPFRASLMVCPECGYHVRVGARDRLRFLIDDRSFTEWDEGLASVDSRSVDDGSYTLKQRESRAKTGERDAIVTGHGAIGGTPLAIAVFEFGFMGGSMGSVVGEKLTRLFGRASERLLPVVAVTASGGARMQEGTLALLQMAKVTLAVTHFRRQRRPLICVLADPTTGGVAASLAMQGDLIIAEPGARVGFAGPRVIEQTIRAALPARFQKAEHILQHGLIDAIVPRPALRATVRDLLRVLTAVHAHA